MKRMLLFVIGVVVLVGCTETTATSFEDICLINCFKGPTELPPMTLAHGVVFAWANGDSSELVPAVGAGVFQVDTLAEQGGAGPQQIGQTDSVGAYSFAMPCDAHYEVYAWFHWPSTNYRSDTVTVQTPTPCAAFSVPALVIRGPG